MRLCERYTASATARKSFPGSRNAQNSWSPKLRKPKLELLQQLPAMASLSSSAAPPPSKVRRRHEGYRPDCDIGELSSPFLAMLGASEVLHTGIERGVRDTFAEAITALPIDASTAKRLLAPVASSGEAFARPHVDARTDGAASLMLLAPLYPTLRALTVREAASAWVLADFLCLGAAARRLEEDIVQRFMESPVAEADWCDALTVDGCPACDTLWAQVTELYAALRGEWRKDAPIPAVYGESPSAAQRETFPEWRRDTSVAALESIMETDPDTLAGVLFPVCLATLQHSTEAAVLRAALEALASLTRVVCITRGVSLGKECATVLGRFTIISEDVVVAVCEVLAGACKIMDETSKASRAYYSRLSGANLIVGDFLDEGGLTSLVDALGLHSSSVDAVISICRVLHFLSFDLSAAAAADIQGSSWVFLTPRSRNAECGP